MHKMRSNPNCNGDRRDKVALRTTCTKNVKFKIIKIRTGCQYVGYFYCSEILNWAVQNLRLSRGLDIAASENFMQIKVEALGHRRQPLNRLTGNSQRANSQQFINVFKDLKLMAELLGI